MMQRQAVISDMPQLGPEGQLSLQSIGDIQTEAGAVIPDVHIAYHLWGKYAELPDGTNNVVLIEHALTGDSNAADWWADLIGPGKEIGRAHV